MARTTKAARRAALTREYKSAKRARTKAGEAYRERKTPSNFQAYKHAERHWQIVGEELGKLTKTHKPRRAQTHIFRKYRGGPAAISAFGTTARRRKAARSRKSR